MYQIGALVVYGIHGVCRVAELEERTVDKKKVVYLAIEPLEQEGARFLIPTHSPAAMAKVRPLLTKEELDAMLISSETNADAWIREENQRKQLYKELISSGDRIRLMQMVRTLYRHRAEQISAGRKVHMCDENFLRDAEKLLAGEIAVVTGTSLEKAKKLLRSKAKKDA